MNDENRLRNLAKHLSIVASIVGGAISAVSGQIAYAAVPFSVSLVLMNDTNRRQWQLVEHIEQNHQVVVADIQRHLKEVENQLGQLNTAISQLNEQPQKYLTKTHLTPIVGEIHQIQQKLRVMELSELKSLSQQVQEQQQHIDALDASSKTLHKSYYHLTQLQQQLAEVERVLQTELFTRTTAPSLKPTSASVKSPHRSKNERVAIFIDAANLYHAASNVGININYTHLLSILKAKSKVCRVFLYTGVEPTNEKQQKFISGMQRQGYQVVSKEVIRREDGSRKANLDVELAFDMVDLADTYDTAVLVSGDGDFTFPVKKVQSRGKRVEVVSFGSSTSVALSKVADSYLDLETILDEIC